MHRSLCLAMAAGTAVPIAAHASPPPRRVEFSLEGALLLATPSAYNRAVNAFGYEVPLASGSVALRALWTRTPHTRLGLRVGYQNTQISPTGAVDGDFPLGTPGATMTGNLIAHLTDVSAVGRYVVYYDPIRRFRFDIAAELGVVVAAFERASFKDLAVLPRAAASFFVGYDDGRSGLLFGARLGFQYIGWNGTREDPLDPVFSGVTLGLEIGSSL